MEKRIVRSTRIRIKPLQYWKNERIHYNIKGDISLIEAPPSSSLHNIISLKTPLIAEQNKSQRFSKRKNAFFNKASFPISEICNDTKIRRSQRKKPESNLSTKLEEIELLAEKDEFEKFKQMCNQTLLKEAQPHSVLRKSTRNLSPSVLSQSTADSSKQPPLNVPETKAHNCSSYKNKKLLGSVNQLDNSLLNLESISEEDDPVEDKGYGCSRYQGSVDISQLKIKEPGPPIFRLENMFKAVTERGEHYFIERGPYDSSTGLFTGFIFLQSPTLYWGTITFPREIFVIEGSGVVELRAADNVFSEHLFKGTNYEIYPVGELLVRKDEGCSLLKLFVTFTYKNVVS